MENPDDEKREERAREIATQATEGYSVGRPQIEKVRYHHNAMIDLLINNPGMSQGELARHFGMSQSWVCTIMASDAFQVMLARRREELVDPALLVTIEEKFKALAEVSVQKLMEHLHRPEAEIDPEVLIKAATLGAKTMGIGGHAAQKTIVLNSDERLKTLSEKLTGLLKDKREIIDVESKDVEGN